MLYSCTPVATGGVKGLNIINVTMTAEEHSEVTWCRIK